MRVSKFDMHCENQRKAIERWLSNNECEYQYFIEEETTRKTRPVKEFVMNAFRNGDFDTVVINKIDRFARSFLELIPNVEEIVNNGGRFVSINNNFDFTKKSDNASQRLQLQIFAAFAQFERDIIRERTFEGLDRARAEGKTLGHPKGQKNKKTRVYKTPPLNGLSVSLVTTPKLIQTENRSYLDNKDAKTI